MATPIAVLDDFADVEHFLCTAPEIQFQQCAQRCRQLIAQPKERKAPADREADTTLPAAPNMNELIATGNRSLALATVRAYQQKIRATLDCEILCERAKLRNEELQERARIERERSKNERKKKKKRFRCVTM